MNRALRGVIFDFDGVVVDSHSIHKRAWKTLLESAGRRASEEELQFVLDGRKREDILRYFLGDLDAGQVREYCLRKEEFFRNEAAAIQTIEGLESFMEELAGSQVPCGIASSGSRSRVDYLLDQLGLKKHFQVVVTGDDVERGKPDPAIFLKAAKDLQRDSSELIVFEDAPSGVIAAKSAGMACVGIAQPDRAAALLKAGAEYVVPDFRFLSSSKLLKVLG
jgi:HAD superfamily hydrolase (TIGR01509 family)